jgi:hypothetical protein
MTHDIFENLADSVVPPVPSQLEAGVHRRINAALLATHLFDFAFNALPQTLATLAGGVLQLIAYTATGRFYNESDGGAPNRG